jgi:Ni/Co efflux regulator RcnB
MKKTLLASAAAFALLAAVPALAAPDDHHGAGGGGGNHSGGGHEAAAPAPVVHGGGAGGGGHHDQSVGHGGGAAVVGGGGTMMSGSRTHAGRGHNSAFDSTVVGGGGGTMMSGSTHHHDRTNTGTNNTPPNGMSQGSGGRHGAAIFGIGGHGFQAAPNRHVDHNSAQIRALRANRNASRHFHAGNYRGPHGYSYRRYSYGDFLPALFFTSDYWLSDYSDYDLPYAPPGTVWVRYGDDAVLVDRYTGEIISVEYGLFD